MKLIFIHLLQPSIIQIYKLKKIIHYGWLRRDMKCLFPNYMIMLKLLIQNFESNNLIKNKPIQEDLKSWDERVDWKFSPRLGMIDLRIWWEDKAFKLIPGVISRFETRSVSTHWINIFWLRIGWRLLLMLSRQCSSLQCSWSSLPTIVSSCDCSYLSSR